MSTMAQSRAWPGPTVFSFGFRPFFLAGALYAAGLMALWVPIYFGTIALPIVFDPVTWHVHELLFGYVLAVIAGFLLTAVPNWTGRLPVVGYPLIGLFVLWLIGRGAVLVSGWLDPVLLAVLSLAFPVTLVFVVAREVVIANNLKNLAVVAAVSVLPVAQLLMQIAHAMDSETSTAARLGIAGVVALIMIIGGRVTPSFTRNWIKKANPGREPAPPNRFDLVALIAAAVSLIAWVFADHLAGPLSLPVALALIVTGVLHLARQARWAPDRVLAEPVVIVLHVGYVFVPIGFLLSGLAMIEGYDVPAIAGIHAWSAGAIGVMTLAVMTRATLGHTGREIRASRLTVAIYLAVFLAAVARVASALLTADAVALLEVSAVLWCAAFLSFAVVYGRMLLAERA